jgi:hypothetical protein
MQVYRYRTHDPDKRECQRNRYNLPRPAAGTCWIADLGEDGVITVRFLAVSKPFAVRPPISRSRRAGSPFASV